MIKRAGVHVTGVKLHTSRQCNRPKHSASFVKRRSVFKRKRHDDKRAKAAEVSDALRSKAARR
jgi:hypothetical protein